MVLWKHAYRTIIAVLSTVAAQDWNAASMAFGRVNLNFQPRFLFQVGGYCSGGVDIFNALAYVAEDSRCVLLQNQFCFPCSSFPKDIHHLCSENSLETVLGHLVILFLVGFLDITRKC